MDGIIIGGIKKVVLIMIAAAISTYGMIMYESREYVVVAMLVTVSGIFLFFWTTFLYHPNIKTT